MNSPSIILFDGQCNVCNTFVQFVIRRDPAEKFQFAPLQSEQAAALFKSTLSDQPARACVPTSSTPPTSSTTSTALQTLSPTSSPTSPPTPPPTSSTPPTPLQTSPLTSPQTLPPTPPPLDSIMLICQGKVLLRSDAVLAIARGLRFPWPLLTVFRIVPRPIRDGAYRIFARNRYRWFGQCNIGTHTTTSTSNIKSRFL